MSKLRYVSLFTGIGGFDLGFDRADMKCVGQVEIDTAARSVLARHWPDVPRMEDVRDVRDVAVDLICGGFPCQDVSVAGRRAGLAGERSGLWFEFRRIIERNQPRWVVIENVPGLLSSNGGRDFATVIRGLVECGYSVAWRILDAQHFGVPQRRRRVFIVGHLGDGRAAEVLFEREGGEGDFEKGRQARPELARDVAASLRNGGNGIRGRNIDAEHGLVVMAHGQANDEIVKDGSPSLTLNHEAPIVAGRDVVNTFNGYTGGADDNDAQGGHLVSAWHENKSDNLAFNDTARALRANASHSYQGVGVRRFTPLECERLQGFPDGWTADQSDSARYRQLGNAVAVPVAEWLGRRIVEAS